MRIDQLLGEALARAPRETHGLIAEGAVAVDGEVVSDCKSYVSRFCRIELLGELCYERRARYILLHKPEGVVSATVDAEHQTVVELIGEGVTDDLHLAGRLDRWTTGALLLTNDGSWSKRLTRPESKVSKTYLLQADRAIPAELVEEFAKGVTLPGDGAVTRPAELEILAQGQARLVLHEGRHHQIKRMFAVSGLRVVRLHRERIGRLGLGDLAEGDWRDLEPGEIEDFYLVLSEANSPTNLHSR